MVLLSQMEIFSNIESRIEGAVQRGEDNVVQALDREMDPLLTEILQYRARDAMELHRQMRFITELIQRSPEDPARVLRLTRRLNELMQDYFLTGPLRVDEGQSSDLTPPFDPATESHARSPYHSEIARVAVISGEYRFLYCNARLAEDFRYKPGLMTGRSLLDFCSRAVFDREYRNHLDICLAGALREFNAASLSQQRDAPRFRVRLTPLRNMDRRISAAVMVMTRLEA